MVYKAEFAKIFDTIGSVVLIFKHSSVLFQFYTKVTHSQHLRKGFKVWFTKQKFMINSNETKELPIKKVLSRSFKKIQKGQRANYWPKLLL